MTAVISERFIGDWRPLPAPPPEVAVHRKRLRTNHPFTMDVDLVDPKAQP
jgi:hypothetical protein